MKNNPSNILRILLEAEDPSYSLDPASHRRSKEEKDMRYRAIIQKKINNYIRNGSIGDLDLSGTLITKLPNNLKMVRGDLNLSQTLIEELPDGLEVDGDLDLSASEITKLPYNLVVKGDLLLHYAPISGEYTKNQIKRMSPGIQRGIYM